MSDLISRQAAIELIHSLYPSPPIMRKNRERWKEKYGQYIEVEKVLDRLPSAQPERKTMKRSSDMDHGFKLHPDGTLEITMPKGVKVGRVLVCEAGTQGGRIYYDGLVDQYKWERDVAISQLHDLGYELGEKVRISAEPESLSDAYMKAVWTWLLDYQNNAAELEGRYTPYEVLSWVANDWRKEHG